MKTEKNKVFFGPFCVVVGRFHGHGGESERGLKFKAKDSNTTPYLVSYGSYFKMSQFCL
jgi:hypothetical protein